MSLHDFPDLVQRSEEWYEQRRGIVTASVVGQLVTSKTIKPAANDYSRALTASLVAERINGWTSESTYVSNDMMQGILDEPVVRQLYSQHYAPVAEVGFMVRDDWGFRIGYSPDGLVGTDGLIEVKSRRPKGHLVTVLGGEVPSETMAQIQCGLLVSGREWCDYISYSGGMPMWVKRVEPDLRWAEAIVEVVRTFEETAAQMVATYEQAVIGLPATERSTYFTDVVI